MAASDIKRHPAYWEKDPEKKDRKWAATLIPLLRGEWSHIVDVAAAKTGLEYLLGTQNVLAQLQESFKAGGTFLTNLKKKDLAIAVMDRIRNIMLAEFLKSAFAPHVEAIDVAADIQKKRDKQLLKGRPIIEGTMTDLETRVGNPAYKLPYDEFDGNVEAFDQLGLNDRSPEDVEFFMQNFHRLWHEADAEELIKGVMKHNHFEIYAEKLINDILAKMAVSFQVFAVPGTGEIRWKYLDPLEIKAIKGERPDYKDSMAVGWEKKISVRAFLEFAGPEFDWTEKEHRDALNSAINSSNNTNYAYVTNRGCWSVDDEGKHYLTVSYQQMLRMTVGVGYIEWKSVDVIMDKKENKENGLLYPLNSTEKQEGIIDELRFDRVRREVFKTYKSWYLGNGAGIEFIFRFGPLYHMITEGINDELSSYSIHILQGTGKSATQIAEPFIDVVNEAFYKMLWAIKESTPRKRIYNYDALIELAKKLSPTTNSHPFDQSNAPANNVKIGIEGQVMGLIEKYKHSLIEMVTNSKVEGREGSPQRASEYTEGGLDPLAPAMQTVMDWAEAQVSAKLGINPLRDAYAPNPKDGYKIQMEAIQSSRNATFYVPWMMENIIISSSTSTLSIAQDGIENKTIVYDFVENLIGPDGILSFKSLNKVPHHTYGIYVEVFSGEDKKREIKTDAQIAFQRGEISYGEYLIVREMDNYKKAGQILEFYKNKNRKLQEEAAAAAHEREMQLVQAKTQGELAVIDRKGYWDVQEREMWGKYYMAAYQTPADTAIQKKQMDIDTNAQKLDEKANAQIKVNAAKVENAATAPLPPSTSPGSGPLPAAAPEQLV